MTDNDQQPTGDAMRRKVRRATAGVVGAAVVTSAVVTAGLAYAAGTDDQAFAGDDEAQAAQPSTTSQLAAPTQAPSASNGRRHAASGGS